MLSRNSRNINASKITRYTVSTVPPQDIYSQDPNVHWGDIVGLDAAKRLVKEAVVYPIKVIISYCNSCPHTSLPLGDKFDLLALVCAKDLHTTPI